MPTGAERIPSARRMQLRRALENEHQRVRDPLEDVDRPRDDHREALGVLERDRLRHQLTR